MKKIIGMVVCMLVTITSVLPAVVATNDTAILDRGVYKIPVMIDPATNFENSAVNKKVSSSSTSDDQSWQWAKKAGAINSYYEGDSGSGISVDSNGNSYLTGVFLGTASFGDFVLTSNSDYIDIFVAKLDTNGAWLWAKQAGGSGKDMGEAISVDSNGNSYVTGWFEGTASFGDFVLTSIGANDIYVAKLDTNGNWQWVKQAGGNGHDVGYDIDVDFDGNLYVTGQFTGTASFDDVVLTSSGGEDIFVAKLDANGDWQWAKQAGGSYDEDEGWGVGFDFDGNLYVTGQFGGTASFGSTVLVGSGIDDIFVAKLDANGDWQWAKKAGGVFYDRGYGIGVDSDGNPYIAGWFQGTASFDDFILTSLGLWDTFVAKLDSNGNWQWAKQSNATGTDGSSCFGISVDSIGNSYIIGQFRGEVPFGNFVLTSDAYGGCTFAAKLDTNGNWQWAKQAEASGFVSSMGMGIDIDSNGNSYVSGTFSGRISFGDDALKTSSAYDNDIFIAKLGENKPPNKPTISGPASGNAGTSYEYTFISTDPDGDNVSYYIKWGDGSTTTWTAFQPSGTLYSENHTWNENGIYIISAKAKDIYGRESGWARLYVIMPMDQLDNQQSNPQVNPSSNQQQISQQSNSQSSQQSQNNPGNQQSNQLLQNLILRHLTTK